MESLSTPIKRYLFSHGRNLERALYLYHVESAKMDDVIAALKAYQNPDGGFGHGIEPDFHTPESTPIGTWSAINVLRLLPIDHHPITDEVLSYLLNCPYQTNGLYAYSIPSVNQHPHAPWWHFQADKNTQDYNPTASLLGFMIKHLSKENSVYPILLKRLNKAISHFMRTDVSDMHELRCFIELYHDLPLELISMDFEKKLETQILKTIDTNKENWFTSYTVLPSTLIINKKTPGYEKCKTLLIDEHKLLIKKRNEHGIWSIPWDWSDHDPTAFEKAKKAWEGIIALGVLLRLKTFDFEELA